MMLGGYILLFEEKIFEIFLFFFFFNFVVNNLE